MQRLPLPTGQLSLRCTGPELSQRLRALAEQSHVHLQRRSRARAIGWWSLIGSWVLGLVLMAFSDAAKHTMGAGLLVGGSLALLRLNLGRVTSVGRGILWALLWLVWLLFLAVLAAIDIVPSFDAMLFALDLRNAPVGTLLGLAVASLGLYASLRLDRAYPPGGSRELQNLVIHYVHELARPLAADAALQSPVSLRLTPQLPPAEAWRGWVQGNVTFSQLQRTLLQLEVPLEHGEAFTLRVVENALGRVVTRRNLRGKTKVKNKGFRRAIDVHYTWSLRAPAPNGADLTPHLHQHLGAALHRHGQALQLRAQGEPRRISARLRLRGRSDDQRLRREDLPDPALVLEVARFMAGIRASLPR